jgi:hypothetical protein
MLLSARPFLLGCQVTGGGVKTSARRVALQDRGRRAIYRERGCHPAQVEVRPRAGLVAAGRCICHTIRGLFLCGFIADEPLWLLFWRRGGYSSFFMSFVPIRNANMKTIAWAVAAARVEFMFILLPWPVAREVGLCVLQRTFQSCSKATAVLVIDYISDEELTETEGKSPGLNPGSCGIPRSKDHCLYGSNGLCETGRATGEACRLRVGFWLLLGG